MSEISVSELSQNTSIDQPPGRKTLWQARIGQVVVSVALEPRTARPRLDIRAEPVPVIPESVPAAPITAGRRMAGRACGVVAAGAAALSAPNLRWEDGKLFEVPYTGLYLALFSAILLGLSIYLLRPALVFARAQPKAAPATRPINWITVGLALACMLVVGEVNTNLVIKGWRFSQHWQMLLLVGGMLLAAHGFGAFRGLSVRGVWRAVLDRSLVPLYLITLLALVLRVVELSGALHIMIDELHLFDAVAQLWSWQERPIMHPMNGLAAMPFVFAYFQQGVVGLFGPDMFGVRLGAAIAGTLTIPALYFLARWMFDRPTAILAAFLLAVFPPHIHFSRLAIINIADPLFGVFALAFLVRALKHNRQEDYVLAGLSLGLVNYFYEGGRLLFVGVFGLWFAWMLVTSRPVRHWRGIAAMIATGLVVIFPYYYWLLGSGAQFTSRLQNEGVRPKYLVERIGTEGLGAALQWHWDDALSKTFYHTIHTPDSSQFYYGGYTGIVPWYLLPFYFLGLFYSAWRLRSMGLLLWIWIAASILGISLVTVTDWTVRFVVMFPAMCLLIAIGMRYVAEMLLPEGVSVGSWRIRMHGGVLLAGVALVAAALGVVQVADYFGPHLGALNRQVQRNTTFDFFNAFYRAYDYMRENRLAETATFYYFIPEDKYVFRPVIDNTIYLEKPPLRYEVIEWAKLGKSPDTVKAQLAALPRDQRAFFALIPPDEAGKQMLVEVFGTALSGPYFSNYRSVPLDLQFLTFVYEPRR